MGRPPKGPTPCELRGGEKSAARVDPRAPRTASYSAYSTDAAEPNRAREHLDCQFPVSGPQFGVGGP